MGVVKQVKHAGSFWRWRETSGAAVSDNHRTGSDGGGGM